jgi:ubiquinone/menaquinone biosynthesis C-methylase UbiE
LQPAGWNYLMEVLFDEQISRRYDSWYLSPVGRYVEKMENELILGLLKPGRNQSLLDVGCGTGNHLLLFQKMGLDVTGIDPSEAMLRVARDKLGHRGELHLGVAEDLPFDDNSFDIVIFVTSLEFSSNPFRAMAEVFRVARERVFVGVLNRISANGVHRRVAGLFRPGIFRYARFFSVWELQYIIHRILGVCKMEWGSVILLPLSFIQWNQRLDLWVPRRKNPFGAFLGIQVEILYTRQAILDPLDKRWLSATSSEAPMRPTTGMHRARDESSGTGTCAARKGV